MKYFLLFYEVVDKFAEKREPYRPKHLGLIDDAHKRGELLLAGAYGDPPSGAALLFRANSADDVRAFAEADPYVTSGSREELERPPLARRDRRRLLALIRANSATLRLLHGLASSHSSRSSSGWTVRVGTQYCKPGSHLPRLRELLSVCKRRLDRAPSDSFG